MKETLNQYNQSHLMNYIDELNDSEQNELRKQIETIDFELMSRLYKAVGVPTEEAKTHEYNPIKSVSLKDHDNQAKYEALGSQSIKEGKLAVVLMAGGQGSRLGFDGPKGAYDIGLGTGESLFGLQAKSLLMVAEQTGVQLKWYVMTSQTNHEETVKFFIDNEFFGYDPSKVRFFSQGMLPAVSENGQIILESKGQISFSPNGNGGVYLGLRDHGIIDEMRNDGVEWIFMYGVDNALVKIAEPAFFGYTLESGCKIASKVVKKKEPGEKVGVVCYRDGRPGIVEYSELGDEMSHMQNPDGSLMYDNANIVNHLIHLDLIDELLGNDLEYHIAHKFVDGMNVTEEARSERKPNAYKFETFIFDIFKYCNDMAVVEVVREEEFAPVKNKEGKDSPESARMLVEAYRNR